MLQDGHDLCTKVADILYAAFTRATACQHEYILIKKKVTPHMPEGAECGGTGGSAALLFTDDGSAIGFGDVPEDLARLGIVTVCLLPGCGQSIQESRVELPSLPRELRMRMQRSRTLTFVQTKKLDTPLMMSVHGADWHSSACHFAQ